MKDAICLSPFLFGEEKPSNAVGLATSRMNEDEESKYDIVYYCRSGQAKSPLTKTSAGSSYGYGVEAHNAREVMGGVISEESITDDERYR